MLAVEQSPNIASNDSGAHTAVQRVEVTEIEAVRAELCAWGVRKSGRVLGAVLNLDGWLAVLLADPSGTEFDTDIDVLACTARAVETLRSALRYSAAPSSDKSRKSFG